MSANSFERHGIDHLSPSSLNLWAAEPALWVMERLLGRKSSLGANAARGRAAEHGIHLGLLDPSLPVADCAKAAESAFDREMALNPDERRESERRNISGYVEQGLKELRQYGIPTAYQEKVSISLDDVPVPVIGFIDWRFDQHGLVVDLKTAERLPSTISDSHGRQGAVYVGGHGNFGMRFAYVKPSPGKSDGRAVAVYEMSGDDVRRHLDALRQIAIRLGRFLALSSDAAELAGLLVPNYDTFYWNNATTRANGTAVYGF
ncbi:conserved hypothetical protein [Rhodospirillaceae bacterium LM-1]|nr:conserved hypothetical protein [Rhodospirillaceae bacterium LM-1]